jgi:hypothetical protein
MSSDNIMRRVRATRNPRRHIPASIRDAFWGVAHGRAGSSPLCPRVAFALLTCALLGPIVAIAQEPARPLSQPTSADVQPSSAIQPASPVAGESALLASGVPTPASAMRAFNAVDSWVRALDVPKNEQPGAPSLFACTGASITLRLDGKIIGRGSAFTLDGAAQKDVIARAARSAIAEAKSRMPGDRDALFAERARELAKSIIISLELAGTPVPIDLDDWSQAAIRINPGVDGVAIRFGERTEATFPSWMLCTQTEPATAMQGLISRLGTEPGMGLLPLADLKKKHGVVFYRVPVTHLAQTKPGASAQFLQRGGVVLESARIDRAELVRWGGLLRQRIGSLFPAEGQPTSETQTLAVTTVARAALIQWSQVVHDDSAIRLASVIDANARADRRTDLDHALANSVWIPGSIDDVRRDPTPNSDALRTLVGNDGEFRSDVPVALRSRVVLALALDEEFTRASAGARALYAASTPISLAGQMPWLGWASLRLAGPTGDIPSAIALREMRGTLWNAQLQIENLGTGERDMAGGLRVGSLLPSWHLAQPLAFLATMLRERRLTEASEAPRETARLLASLRFLRQLTVDENSAWMFERPGTAIGGVRASPWDQRMPLEATAMTLIAVCETIRSIDELATRPLPPAPQP